MNRTDASLVEKGNFVTATREMPNGSKHSITPERNYTVMDLVRRNKLDPRSEVIGFIIKDDNQDDVELPRAYFKRYIPETVSIH